MKIDQVPLMTFYKGSSCGKTESLRNLIFYIPDNINIPKYFLVSDKKVNNPKFKEAIDKALKNYERKIMELT